VATDWLAALEHWLLHCHHPAGLHQTPAQLALLIDTAEASLLLKTGRLNSIFARSYDQLAAIQKRLHQQHAIRREQLRQLYRPLRERLRR